MKEVMIMNHTFTIKPYCEKDLVMLINTSQSLALGIEKNNRGYISFGTQKLPVEIQRSAKVKENEILLSQDIISGLYLPGYPVFEICVEGNEIIIGPYIGILIKRKADMITEDFLNESLVYTREYSRIHGAVVIFALEHVNMKERLIEGYCYNPHNNRWENGIFPYPSSIFCKFPLKKSWRDHFLSTIGNTWFNGQFINKWKMHQLLTINRNIGPHHKDMILYHSPRNIFDYLKKYRKVFVKPIAGTYGKNIVRIELKDNKIIMNYKKDDEPVFYISKNKEKIKDKINQLLVPKKYIIQQHIKLVKYKKSVIDFRCVVQKDQTTNWKCLGIIGRISAPNREITNIHNGGKALPMVDVLKNFMQLSETEIVNIEEKMKSISLEIGKALDEFGVNAGHLGIDIGLDETGHLWVIEVNNRNPNAGTEQFTNNMELFYQTKTTPLFYAKVLAGFK